jgi:aerobic-type carbon monoxide dehydrogenase small subunit (CoxS/CutS family)
MYEGVTAYCSSNRQQQVMVVVVVVDKEEKGGKQGMKAACLGSVSRCVIVCEVVHAGEWVYTCEWVCEV